MKNGDFWRALVEASVKVIRHGARCYLRLGRYNLMRNGRNLFSDSHFQHEAGTIAQGVESDREALGTAMNKNKLQKNWLVIDGPEKRAATLTDAQNNGIMARTTLGYWQGSDYTSRKDTVKMTETYIFVRNSKVHRVIYFLEIDDWETTAAELKCKAKNTMITIKSRRRALASPNAQSSARRYNHLLTCRIYSQQKH